MPPLPVIANTYRVALDWSVAAPPRPVNVLHFRDSSASPSTVGTRIDAFFDSIFGASGGQLLKTTQSLAGVFITPLDGVSATQYVALTGSHIGDQTGNTIPEQAALVSLHTGLRGPAHRGRVFWGPVTEDYANAGTIPAGQAANLRVGWETALVVAAASGLAQVVASYHLATASNITSVSVSTHLGYISRRLRATR